MIENKTGIPFGNATNEYILCPGQGGSEVDCETVLPPGTGGQASSRKLIYWESSAGFLPKHSQIKDFLKYGIEPWDAGP